QVRHPGAARRALPAADAPMIVARDGRVALPRIGAEDLPKVAGFEYTVSIVEPMTGRAWLAEVFAQTAFWTEDAGALAITVGDRLAGAGPVFATTLVRHRLDERYPTAG